jgi:hypothetical protein
VAVCVLTGFLGWWLGPAVSGAPDEPSAPTIGIQFVPPLVGVHVDQTLVEQDPAGEFQYFLTAFGGTVIPAKGMALLTEENYDWFYELNHHKKPPEHWDLSLNLGDGQLLRSSAVPSVPSGWSTKKVASRGINPCPGAFCQVEPNRRSSAWHPLAAPQPG